MIMIILYNIYNHYNNVCVYVKLLIFEDKTFCISNFKFNLVNFTNI